MVDVATSSQGFPDVRWGRSDTAIARFGHRMVSTRLGSWIVRSIVPLDRWVLTKTQGRFTALGPFGAPLLLLTATGARSGQPRTTPLVYLLDDDRILLAGSNFGQAHHPAWSANLLAHPDAHVTIAGVRYPVVAELLDGEDQQRTWKLFQDTAQTYRTYATRTDRGIRMFSLRRADGEEK
jgi:deazaflavin-dependent oxidoreductase (nitroreductase family)